MRNSLYLLGLTVLAFACGPKNEEVTDAQVTVAPPADALDSIANTHKDAVRTDENETNPTMPLPQPVMQKLAQQFQGWQQPTLTEEAAKMVADDAQGPIIVRGDFDGDTRQDVALQLQQGNDIVVVAALQQQDGVYDLRELKRDILFNERGKLKSLFYLYLVQQGETLHSEEPEEDIEVVNDAVAVGLQGEDVVYIYQNGSFKDFIISK